MSGAKEIETLIEQLSKLPGLGPRSARRAVLHLIRKREGQLIPLANKLHEVAQKVRQCLNCGNVCTSEICKICQNDKRLNGQLCVVEDVADLWAMERTSIFKGRFHVLGGTLSAIDAIGPNELGIPKLINRIQSEGIVEIIMALKATIDGQTTAHYIADQVGDRAQVTSLAKGVPMGGELDYLDEGTISAALQARNKL